MSEVLIVKEIEKVSVMQDLNLGELSEYRDNDKNKKMKIS